MVSEGFSFGELKPSGTLSEEGVNLEGFEEFPGFGESDADVSFQPMPPPLPTAPSTVVQHLPIRKTSNFMEVYNSKNTVEFVFEGLLPNKGLMYVGARSGTGKTIFVIQMAVDLILGRDTMSIKRGKDLPPQKLVILSLEMGEEEFQARILSMYPELTEEEQKLLADGIVIYHDPEPFRLWTDDHQVDFIRLVKSHKATGVIIDSASVSFASSLKDDMQVNSTIEILYGVRNRLTMWMIIVCHTRKLPAGIVGNMEDLTVDEIFGHSGVAQSASAILLMHHDKKDPEGKDGKNKIVYLMNLKARFGAEFAPFKMYLPTIPPLQFRRKTPIPLQPLTPEKRKEANKVAKEISFGDSLKDIDFGALGGVEDE
jgi:hypothetical protein